VIAWWSRAYNKAVPKSAPGSSNGAGDMGAPAGRKCVYNARKLSYLNSKEKRMNRIVTALVGSLLMLDLAGPFTSTVAVAAQEDAVAKTNLKVGDVAPDFTLLSDKWEQVKLSDYRGKKNVILAFYVLAFTGG
jgi:AhpC/TSA family